MCGFAVVKNASPCFLLRLTQAACKHLPSSSYVCAMTHASSSDISLEMSVRHSLNEIQSDLNSEQPPFSVFLNILRRVHKTFDECIGYEVELEMRSLDRHRRLQERLEADQQAAADAADEFAEPLRDDEAAAADFLDEDVDANWPSTMPMPPPPPMREEVEPLDDVEPIQSHTPRVVPRRITREPEPQPPQLLRLRSRLRSRSRSPVRKPRPPLAPPPLHMHVRCKARPGA